MTSHFYTAVEQHPSGTNPRYKVKLLCTKNYVLYCEVKAGTIPSNVTCHECLKILIPRAQARVDVMKRNLRKAEDL